MTCDRVLAGALKENAQKSFWASEVVSLPPRLFPRSFCRGTIVTEYLADRIGRCWRRLLVGSLTGKEDETSPFDDTLFDHFLFDQYINDRTRVLVVVVFSEGIVETRVYYVNPLVFESGIVKRADRTHHERLVGDLA